MATTLNNDFILFSTGQTIGASSSATMKNRIINGGMVIDQRNNGASVTLGAVNPQYSIDRWYFQTAQASKLSFQQNAGSVTPPVGFSNYLGITSLSAYSSVSTDYFTFAQRIEAFNTNDLAWGTSNAKTVTLSFWVYSSLTGTFSGALNNNQSTNGASYAFTYSIPTANTWTYITITVQGSTIGTWSNGYSICVVYNLGCGSTYLTSTPNSWQANGQYFGVTGTTSVVGTSGATFYLTGVQLEVGTVASSFDYRVYSHELAMCQRYLPAYYGYGQVPGCGNFYNTSQAYLSINFPVETRVPPTGIYTPNASVFSVGIPGLVSDTSLSSISFNQATTLGALYGVTASSATSASAGSVATVRANNSASLFYFTGCEL